MRKAYVVSYNYTETYASPREDVWERENAILIVTTNKARAVEVRDEHNSKNWTCADIREVDLDES